MNRVSWEIKQLINEFKKKNIDFELLNNQRIYFKLNNEKDLIEKYDVFLERSLSFLRGLYSAAILELKGYKVINNYECLNLTGNKLLTSLKLIENNIPTPKTCVSFRNQSAIDSIEEEIKYPAIIKPIIGSWGRLVAKLENYNCAKGNLECRKSMGNVLQKIYYIQECIKTNNANKPTDLRVIVVGDQCIAAMGRFNPKDEFRSNLAIGGTAENVKIDDELAELSLKAAKAVNGEIVGVDLMEQEGDLKVIEVNGTPQFRGITKATNINVAEKIVNYLEEKFN
ncbi:MAG: RimK family alpha-L-glutamate ligase [Promethearchaeota archaeon]|nr:MAG: RimK family alpha-L-glutamate ligase [Candidatus Lokiarchaeota archaeon]